MSSVTPKNIDLSKYEEDPPKRSSNKAWTHVIRYRKVTQEEGYTEIWICTYCNEIHTGNVGRVEAHLAGIKVKGVAGCPKVPSDVKKEMRRAVTGTDDELGETERTNPQFHPKKRTRNPLTCALQSKSSGLNPIAEGNPSHSTLLGVTNRSGEVFPRSAEMGENSNLNDDFFQFSHLASAIGSGSTPPNSNGTRNFDSTGPEGVEAGDSGMAWLEDMLAGGSNSTSSRLRGSATRSGSSPLHPNGEAGINDSSSLAHQPLPPSTASIEMPGMGVSSQWSNMLQGSGMACPEDAGAGCSNSTSPGFGNSPNISHPACQSQIPGIAMAAPNSLGNIANGPVGPRSPEAGRSERNIRITPPSDCQQQINGATEKFGATADANDARTEENFDIEGICGPTGNSPLNTNRETGSDSNGLADLPPPLNTVSTAMTNVEMSSQRLNFCEISRSGIAGTEDAWAGDSNSTFRLSPYIRQCYDWPIALEVLTRAYTRLRERKREVETQQDHFNWINGGQENINKWLEREREVSKRCVGLLKMWNDATSTGITTQLVPMTQQLTKEVKDLIEESTKFDAFALYRVMEFMKCRLHRSTKDDLRVTLPSLLLA